MTRSVDAKPFAFGIALVGLPDMERALRSVAPEVGKAMNNRIRGALQPIVNRAKADVPPVALSGWDNTGTGQWSTRLGWDPAAVRKGIKLRKGGQRDRATGARAAWRIVNLNPAAAVFELAGRRNPGSPLARSLHVAGHGRASRLIWDAWDRTGGKDRILTEIESAVADAERELQRIVDGAG